MAEEEKKSETPAPAPAPSSGSSGSGQKNIGMAVLCYIGILVLIPLLTDAKNDAFVKFHIKQGLVLLIVDVIIGVISWIPFVGWILALGTFVLFVIGIINAAGGKQTPLPIIGQFGEKINI
ncbi:MAG: hypothetical protein NTZ65_00590 [Candidatus Berkelbacteria bacterium]|nr:hypothetical protein [Candidatus Berkelbacteria bacterium]